MIFLLLANGFANPDNYGMTLSESGSDGPPFAVLDLTQQYLLSISGDEYTQVELPFSWWWYDQYYESVDISSNGVLFFEGPVDKPL